MTDRTYPRAGEHENRFNPLAISLTGIGFRRSSSHPSSAFAGVPILHEHRRAGMIADGRLYPTTVMQDRSPSVAESKAAETLFPGYLSGSLLPLLDATVHF